MKTWLLSRYEGTDGACRDYYKDGLLAAKISGYVKVEKGDWGLATAIRVTPTAIAMMVGTRACYHDVMS